MAAPTLPTRIPARGLLVAVWATLPLTAAPGAARALDDWARGPEVAAAVLLWIAWASGVLALLVPRPIGLTALRAVAPAFLVLAVVGTLAGGVGTLEAAGALIATGLAALLAATPELAIDASNGISYGDESRYPLRTPPALLLTLVPLARTVLVAGVAGPVLLLADGRWGTGAIALAVGLPLAVLAARSLHGLSTRWVIFVPAGFVVLDPFTLADPHLFLRAGVIDLRAADPASESGPAPDDVADLRLGATAGSLDVRLREPVDLSLARPGRRGAVTVRRTARVRVAVVAPARMLADATRRRFAVRAPGSGQPAMPPPTSSSPS